MPIVEVDTRVRLQHEHTMPVPSEVRGATPARTGRGPWSSVPSAAAVITGILLRFVAPSALWLDEAQAVAIARLPLHQLLDALRADGAPPLWYLLLHGWIAVAGSGTTAVRVLPMVVGAAAVPVAWWVGSVAGGRRVALALTVLVATSPFAIRYAAEARMYALLLVLVLAGIGLLLDPRQTRLRTAAIAAVSGALLLTHYWSAFLLAAAVGALAVVAVVRPEARRRSMWRIAAIAVGSLAFVPWLPSFVHQLERTGAPWGRPPDAAVIEMAVRGFAGGGAAGSLLEIGLLLLAGAAAAAPFLSGRRRPALPAVLVGVTLGTLLLGAVSLHLSGDGFAPRHATVAFAPLVLAVALVTRELRPRVAAVAVAALAVLGLVVAVPVALEPRTQAPAVAAVLRDQVAPGDVVAACPDQLAPALTRLLPAADRPTQLFPAGSTPERVDWTDYPQRVAAADPEAFAAALDRRAGAANVWLVASPNYVGVGRRCAAVQRALATLRPDLTRAVPLRRGVFENAALWRAPAPSAPRTTSQETP